MVVGMVVLEEQGVMSVGMNVMDVVQPTPVEEVEVEVEDNPTK